MTSAELKYLIAISKLYDGTKGIKLTDVADKTGVSKVSVFKAVERLEQEGCIQRDAKNKVIITQYGYEQLEKYNILIRWLSGHLERNCKVPADIAEHDATGAICAFSEQSINALTQLITMQKENGHDR